MGFSVEKWIKAAHTQHKPIIIAMSHFSRQPLFVTHHHSTCPGLLGKLAQKWYGGYQTLYAPDGHFPKPDQLQGPIIIMGGAMSANDPTAWTQKELAWIEQLLNHQKAVLGVCLGAQMMAKVLGQRVEPCPKGTLECGYVPLLRQQSSLPTHVYQWHREGVVWDHSKTPEAQILATSPWRNGVCQAFQIQSALGLQFHPEVTLDRILHWTKRDAHDLLKPGARPQQSHIEDHLRYGKAVQKWVSDHLQQLWHICDQKNMNFSMDDDQIAL